MTLGALVGRILHRFWAIASPTYWGFPVVFNSFLHPTGSPIRVSPVRKGICVLLSFFSTAPVVEKSELERPHMKQNTKMPTSSHHSFTTICRYLVIAFCLTALLLPAQGKTTSKADATSTDAQAARSNLDTQRKGKDFPLKTTIATASVRQNVTVEAVLLPYDVCKRVFGTEIAKNYAAVELTVSNQALIRL